MIIIDFSSLTIIPVCIVDLVIVSTFALFRLATLPDRTSLCTASPPVLIGFETPGRSPPQSRPQAHTTRHTLSQRTDTIGDAGFYGSDTTETMNVGGTDFSELGRWVFFNQVLRFATIADTMFQDL